MDKDAHLHELYLTHALNSNGISSWGEDFVRSRLDKQSEALSSLQTQNISWSGGC